MKTLKQVTHYWRVEFQEVPRLITNIDVDIRKRRLLALVNVLEDGEGRESKPKHRSIHI